MNLIEVKFSLPLFYIEFSEIVEIRYMFQMKYLKKNIESISNYAKQLINTILGRGHYNEYSNGHLQFLAT